MATLWPWWVLIGMGVVHGAHPASGWMWATLRGVDARSLPTWWKALWPVALGHVVAIAATVYAVSLGLLPGGPWAQRIAGLVLLGVAAGHLRRPHEFASKPAFALSAALTSAMMATAHGAGLMLVPALVPLCMSGLPARELTASGSLLLGLAAVAVHLAAMLLTAGAIASLLAAGARRMRQRRGATFAPWGALALALAGIGLVATA